MKRRPTPRFLAWVTQSVLGGVGLILITFVCFRLGLKLAEVICAYILLIAPLSLLGSFTVSIILSVAAAACLNYFFTEPLFSFRVDSPQDVLVIAAFVTTSLVINLLTTRLRNFAAA